MACFSRALGGIDGACDKSVGGVKVIYLAEYEDDAFTLSKADDGSSIAVTAVKTPTSFKKYAFRKGNASLTETLNVDDTAGYNYVSSDLFMQFSRIDTAKRVEINALAVGGTMAVVIDANGNGHALGVQEEMSINAGTAQTGAQKADGNFINITLQDTSDEFPPMLTEEALEAFLEAVNS